MIPARYSLTLLDHDYYVFHLPDLSYYGCYILLI